MVQDTGDCALVALHPLADFPFHGQQGQLVMTGDEKSAMGFIKVEEASEVLTWGKSTGYPLDGQLVLNIPESQNLAIKSDKKVKNNSHSWANFFSASSLTAGGCSLQCIIVGHASVIAHSILPLSVYILHQL